MDTEQKVAHFKDTYGRIVDEVKKTIVGHDDVIREVMLCLLCGGHAILEGVPGIGKTLIVRTLADAVGLSFSRIQFTPDLMPADIIGTNIIVKDEQGGTRFEFQAGPIFGNLVLADEINRATPKTQSALLEAMQECSVSVARVTHTLEQPFLVLATENPIEMEGTYPLPEAQLDRFMFKILLQTPALDEITEILERTTGAAQSETSCIAGRDEILDMRRLVREVPVAEGVKQYIGRIVLATHPNETDAAVMTKKYVRYGASPRAGQAMILGAKVLALLNSRYNVAYEDVRAVARPALRHRLILNFQGEAEDIQTDAVVEEVLQRVGTGPRA
ncbi:MAG: MoxR family ATPase [Planctomycetia bacterium]|nr:MoxR family ATPase [Planctomycetia bacterium]